MVFFFFPSTTSHSLRHHSPPEKDSSQEDSSTNTIEKKENEMSEAPIIKAFKELEEGKIFKDGGTQTEKEDSPASNSYFYTPECVFTGFPLFACVLALVFSAFKSSRLQ